MFNFCYFPILILLPCVLQQLDACVKSVRFFSLQRGYIKNFRWSTSVSLHMLRMLDGG